MSGLLSQSIANLQLAYQRVSSQGGLPSDAQQIQQALSSKIPSMISQIKLMQGSVQTFVQTAIPLMKAIQTMLTNNDPISTIQASMATVKSKFTELQSVVWAVSGKIVANNSQAEGYVGNLATIITNNTAMIASLKSQLGSAEREESSAKQNYDYLLALGLLGLIGLAAALALYERWRSEVDDLQKQVSNLNAQITMLQNFNSNCNRMISNLSNLVSTTESVGNVATIISTEISVIDDDLGKQKSRIVIGVMVAAAITEIGVLSSDAS